MEKNLNKEQKNTLGEEISLEERLLGLSEKEAGERLLRFGKNLLSAPKKGGFLRKAVHIITEPMFLLLIIAAIAYILLGEPNEGAVMFVFVGAIIAIDLVQEWKTDRTLQALKELSAPKVKVIRDGAEKEILSEELVPGDIMLLAEGVKIPADGRVLRQSDFSVNESLLTGEAEPVRKQTDKDLGLDHWKKDMVYGGTVVIRGSAAVEITKTGALTEYGKIGSNLASAEDVKTPLQNSTSRIVRGAGILAAALFAAVAVITYFNLSGTDIGYRITQSLLSGIALAMAMIPEEFPVILTVFLSMGAWRLAKKNSIVRKLPAVEALGGVSVLCVDKTGTVTENRMIVDDMWSTDSENKENIKELSKIMGFGCETETYDPMEIAMLEYCENQGLARSEIFSGELVLEYEFSDITKMMAHLWKKEDGLFLAAKGSPESIIAACGLSDKKKDEALMQMKKMSQKGLRVIGIARAILDKDKPYPEDLFNAGLEFMGLCGLYDPPRESVKSDIAICRRAGIKVVMITGDNGETAASIANKIGMENPNEVMTGAELEGLSDEALIERVMSISVFSRVVPEHKMRIVKAFKACGEVVAMTGDGVNDAPALKHAHIGIAMGGRGSEVAREAADMILTDDNFSTIVESVRDGRRIYENIKKAMGYVVTIHVPIALCSLLAPILGIAPDMVMLLPLHIALLELVIDPTCSIVLERLPAPEDIMERPPRNIKEGIFNAKGFLRSMLRGLIIFGISFCGYYYLLKSGAGIFYARAFGLAAIIISSIILVHICKKD